MKNYLRTHKTDIVDAQGKKVVLKGINVGGWLLMEAYFMHSPHRSESWFKRDFAAKCGKKQLTIFEKSFRNHYIQEKDIKVIKQIGLNCIRVPFHYKIVNSKDIVYLDNIVAWARKYKVYLILDLHAAPGCQNHDWHGDSDGKAELWKNKVRQEQTLRVWKTVARRYKDEEWIAGYDILNESVVGNVKKLNSLYKKIIATIRSVDPNHILFIEGNFWATDIQCLEDFKDENYALSVHFYEPIDFTFNLVPLQKFPQDYKKELWSKEIIKKHLEKYAKLAKRRKVPILVGEFGVNARDGLFGEDKWLDYVLALFQRLGFHWTYWTYKAVKNYSFPDGIFSFRANPPWVNRVGPKMGWEMFAECWPKHKKQMIVSWDTKSFQKNKKVYEVLRKHASKTRYN